MKFLIANILSLFLINCAFNPSEDETNNHINIFKSNSKAENNGRYLTSVGELKVLIIYSMFMDDSTENINWKLDKTKLPNWGKDIVNNSTSLNFNKNNITQYFYEMSNGNFMFFGDVYPELIIPKHSQSKYKSIAEVNHEILTGLDSKINYSQYDNWSKDGNGKFINKPDGQVDLIIIVYRDFKDKLFFNNGWTGTAYLYLTKDIETNDNVKISTGRLDIGSGIQSRGAKNGFTYIKYVLAHEVGHFLFGAGHIENVTNLALMTGGPVWNASRGMHSWERERLGWINYIDIPINVNSSINIDDYFKTGTAYRIMLSQDEWYVIENHQKLSKNDYAGSEGIYIYHISNALRFAPQIKIKNADGNWDFVVDTENKKLIKTIPNPNGKNEMNFVKRVKKKTYSCYNEVYGDNSAWGDEYDAFNLEYNNLITHVSNPSTENKTNIEFAVQVKDKNGNKYKVDISFF